MKILKEIIVKSKQVLNLRKIQAIIKEKWNIKISKSYLYKTLKNNMALSYKHYKPIQKQALGNDICYA
jgi:transposase